MLLLGGIAAFFTLLNVLDNSQEVRALETAQNQASSQWAAAQREWLDKAGPRVFEEKKQELTDAHKALIELPNVELRTLERIETEPASTAIEPLSRQLRDRAREDRGHRSGAEGTQESDGIETQLVRRRGWNDG